MNAFSMGRKALVVKSVTSRFNLPNRGAIHGVSACAKERATGIEPALEAWEAAVMPFHYARAIRQDRNRTESYLRDRVLGCRRRILTP